MRILLTADPELPVPPLGYGGIERIVASLAEHFRMHGHDVGLVAHHESQARVTTLFPWNAVRSGDVHRHLQHSTTLTRAARKFCPDVIHSFSRLLYLLRILATHRQATVMSYQRHTGGRGLSVGAKLGGRAFAFTGCSEYICRQGRPRGGAWHAIPNFVDVESIPFQPTTALDAPLLFLSRIEEIKGPHLAIAIARTAQRRLILAGNRVDNDAGQRFWRREIEPHLGHDGVEWVGEVDDSRKWELMKQASALVVPIQWDEPFGIVFVEALAAGVPVITCARGATPEIIAHGVTGFFIEGVADGVIAVNSLKTIDRTACRNCAASRFDRTIIANRYLALYQELIASASGT